MKYEFTITLRPMMYGFDAKEQFRLTKGHLMEIFYPNNIRKYEVSCIAELTKEHNVHYHCMIDLSTIEAKDKMLNQFRKYNKVFGKKSCTQVQYEESYKEYMKKDIEETRKIIGDPIVCDFYGIGKMLFTVGG